MSERDKDRQPTRVMIENVNYPGSTSSVDADMYTAMRDAILEALPTETPGLTIAEMRVAIMPHLSEDLFPGGARVGWWSKSAQLDLEAKGLIARDDSTPLRLRRLRA